MIPEFEKITEEEVELLLSAPILVSILIAGADNEIDNSEIKKAVSISKDKLKNKLALWHFKNQKVVFTNGCFDILHQGHIHLLTQAKAMGNLLIVGLNSDASVSRLKGEGRPLQNEQSRALILASLTVVDAIIIFDEDTPSNLIQAISPHVLVKGGDYTLNTVVGAEDVLAKGGTVEIIPLVEGESTSAIEEKIKKQA